MKIVIEGAGEIGSHLAKMLREEANEVTVIDNDPVRLSTLGGYADVETFLGSPSSIKALRDAGVARADLFIAVYPFTTQEVNIVGALLAKQLGAKKVVARINDEDYLEALNDVLRAKDRTLCEKDIYLRKAKLVRHLLSRGFETDFALDAVDTYLKFG